MPRKQHQETTEELEARYRREVQELVDSGELNESEARKILDDVLRRQARPSTPRQRE